LLAGENAAAYEQLLGAIREAVKPMDIIDEMHIADIAILQWEILRYHRLKSKLIEALGVSYLKGLLIEHIDYEDALTDDVAALLAEGLPEDEEETAESLAQKFTEGDDEAIEKVKKLFDGRIDLAKVEKQTQDAMVNEVLQGYLRREPDAVKTVHEVFTQVGKDMDSFMASALVNNMDNVEHIDRLITSAESRRNNALREIDRRHAALGEALRRTVQRIDDGQFEVIETTADQGKNAA